MSSLLKLSLVSHRVFTFPRCPHFLNLSHCPTLQHVFSGLSVLSHDVVTLETLLHFSNKCPQPLNLCHPSNKSSLLSKLSLQIRPPISECLCFPWWLKVSVQTFPNCPHMMSDVFSFWGVPVFWTWIQISKMSSCSWMSLLHFLNLSYLFQKLFTLSKLQDLELKVFLAEMETRPQSLTSQHLRLFYSSSPHQKT